MTSSQGGAWPPPPPPTPNAKATIVISVLGVLSALLAVATGVLGYQTASITKEKEQAQQSAAASGSDASSLKTRNDQLQAENNSLKSQLGAPTAAVAVPGAPSVKHSGTLNMVNSTNSDLDSPQSDTQWSTGPTDIALSGGNIFPQNRSSQLVLDSAQANYDSCKNNNGYSGSYIEKKQLVAGLNFCVKTSDSRYSAVKVIKIATGKVALDVVTYDPPFTS